MVLQHDGQHLRKSWLKIPLKLLLIIAFVSQSIGIVGATGWTASRNSKKSTDRLVYEIQSETAQRVDREITDLLWVADVINELTAKTIASEQLDLADIQTLNNLYWNHITTFPMVHGLGVGNTKGEVMGFFNQTKDGEIAYHQEYTDANRIGEYTKIELNALREQMEVAVVERQVDARERPWYQVASGAGKPVWTDIYPSVSQSNESGLLINRSRPIFNEDEQLQGVVSTILDLGQVSQLLSKLEISSAGHIYLLQRNGELIGTSDGQIPIRTSRNAPVERLRAIDSRFPFMQASMGYLNQEFDSDLSNIQQAQQLQFFMDGQRQFLKVRPLGKQNGLDWLLVIVTPEANFMEPIYDYARNTLYLCIAALGFAITLGVIISHRLGQSINRISRAAACLSLETFDKDRILGQNLEDGHGVEEFNSLAQSFSLMKQSLYRSFAALQASEERLRLVTENMNDLVCLHKPDGCYLYVTSSSRELLGYSPEELIGQSPYKFFHPEEIDRIRLDSHDVALSSQPTSITYRMRQKSGVYIWLETLTQPICDAKGQIIHLQTTSRDVSDRVQAETQLRHDTLHDRLTDLPNRSLLMERLSLALGRAQQHLDTKFAVLFLDLDHFKLVNDSLGHLVGDELLINVARKLTQLAHPGNLVARLGGDEFVILIDEFDDATEVVALAERLLAALKASIKLTDREVFINASIGIVFGSSDHRQPEDLLRDADLAMYQAKHRGRGQYAFFKPTMRLQAVNRLYLEHDLRRALARREFVLHYQPILDLKTSSIKGFEALIRWQHPERGLVSPGEFIAVAEETGLIVPMGRWILETACQQLVLWQTQFPDQPLTISVNLSAHQLHKSLLQTLEQIPSFSHLQSNSLTLEITESMLVQNIASTQKLLTRIKAMGIYLSIDDFGTGYSCLSYLHQLPVDALKIDRSFVSLSMSDTRNQTITESVLALADLLGIDAIAEGIETIEQLEWLQELGCEFGQGFLFSPSLPVAQATEQLLKNSKQIENSKQMSY